MNHEIAVSNAKEIADRILAPAAGKTTRKLDFRPRQLRRSVRSDCWDHAAHQRWAARPWVRGLWLPSSPTFAEADASARWFT